MQRSQSWGRTKFTSEGSGKIRKSGSSQELRKREHPKKEKSLSRQNSYNIANDTASPSPTRTPSSLQNSINNLTSSYNSVTSEGSDTSLHNANPTQFYYKATLREELDELLDIAIWLDRKIRIQLEEESENMREDITQCISMIQDRDKYIADLVRENEVLRSQLDKTQTDKDKLKTNLNYEKEFSQIMLTLDEEFMD